MSQVVAPLLSKIIARFLLNAENSGWRMGLKRPIQKIRDCAKKENAQTGPMVNAGKTLRQVFKYGVMR